MAKRQPFVIQPQQMEHRGMQVVYVNLVGRRLKAKFIGLAVRHASLDPATGNPHRKPIMFVVAAISIFRCGSSAELASPNHERIFE